MKIKVIKNKDKILNNKNFKILYLKEQKGILTANEQKTWNEHIEALNKPELEHELVGKKINIISNWFDPEHIGEGIIWRVGKKVLHVRFDNNNTTIVHHKGKNKDKFYID